MLITKEQWTMAISGLEGDLLHANKWLKTFQFKIKLNNNINKARCREWDERGLIGRGNPRQ
jgi:hypothetical protein